MFARIFAVMAAFLVTLSTMSASAGFSKPVTRQMVEAQFVTLEQKLNTPGDMAGLIAHLHDSIREDARFVVTVRNPSLSAAHNGQTFEMDKQAYINSYLQGRMLIDGYSVQIRPLRVEIGTAAGDVTTEEVYIERGQIVDLRDIAAKAPPKDFVSRTTCRSEHIFEDNSIRLLGSTCTTDVEYEQAV